MDHIRKYKLLLEFEEAGEIAAVIALIKIWEYDHLHLHGDLAKRIRFELKIMQATRLAQQLEAFIQLNPLEWVSTRDEDDIPRFAKLFRSYLGDNAPAFSEVIAVVVSRWGDEQDG